MIVHTKVHPHGKAIVDQTAHARHATSAANVDTTQHSAGITRRRAVALVAIDVHKALHVAGNFPTVLIVGHKHLVFNVDVHM